MAISKTAEVGEVRNQDDGEWLQVTPGERFKIRIASSQTMGAYAVIEIVADPHNGVPLHIHSKEEEHFIVLEGTLDIAAGDRRWDAPAGTSVTVKKGVPHAWCNPSETPLHMLVGFFAGTNRWIVQSGGRCRRRRQDHGHCGSLRHAADRTAAAGDRAFDLFAAGISQALSGSISHQSDDFAIPRLAALAIGASATKAEGEQDHGNAFATIALRSS
jgi:mannose-6-phosphate isomerase-like protein (cupin superfamily)